MKRNFKDNTSTLGRMHRQLKSRLRHTLTQGISMVVFKGRDAEIAVQSVAAAAKSDEGTGEDCHMGCSAANSHFDLNSMDGINEIYADTGGVLVGPVVAEGGTQAVAVGSGGSKGGYNGHEQCAALNVATTSAAASNGNEELEEQDAELDAKIKDDTSSVAAFNGHEELAEQTPFTSSMAASSSQRQPTKTYNPFLPIQRDSDDDEVEDEVMRGPDGSLAPAERMLKEMPAPEMNCSSTQQWCHKAGNETACNSEESFDKLMGQATRTPISLSDSLPEIPCFDAAIGARKTKKLKKDEERKSSVVIARVECSEIQSLDKGILGITGEREIEKTQYEAVTLLVRSQKGVGLAVQQLLVNKPTWIGFTLDVYQWRPIRSSMVVEAGSVTTVFTSKFRFQRYQEWANSISDEEWSYGGEIEYQPDESHESLQRD